MQDRKSSSNFTWIKSNSIFTERQALRWVQKYIRAFGGDPKKVTLYEISFSLCDFLSRHRTVGVRAQEASRLETT